jgi:protein SCO1/2
VPGVLYARRHHVEEGLPVLGALAPFALVAESGAPLASADLAGKVWVADFVFLGCSESCPLLTTRMSHLQTLLGEEAAKRGRPLPVRLVSFTVDPVNDTPARLAEYATKWKADPSVWTFATGSLADVQHVVADGFKIAYGKVENGAGAFEMMHGNYFVVIDGQMRIRGYYSTDQADEMKKLVRDVVDLATGEVAEKAGAIAVKGGRS